jgi:hypothetical protein
MTHLFDEFSKSLNEALPRRESLRRFGAVLAGAILAPLGAGAAWAAGNDPCKNFCRCSNKSQQSKCLAACRACNGNVSRLCGTCGSYACCGGGSSCCGNYCVDLANDFSNCGECGYACPQPAPNEYGACIDGYCEYACVEGTVPCNGGCTSLDWDPDNCGACGNICPESAPYCDQGVCSGLACSAGLTLCGGDCVYLPQDPSNCGACGNICSGATPYCFQGACTDCGGSWRTVCDGVCVNLLSDASNCGACGNVCAGDYYVCSSGACVNPVCQFVEC